MTTLIFLARAYMSLLDRYDHNEAEVFLRDACSLATPNRRFEDLFEQIHQHFQQMQIFSNSDDSLRIQGNSTKLNRNMSESVSDCLQSNGNDEIDENTLTIDYHDDIFLENIAHLLIFHPVRHRSSFSASQTSSVCSLERNSRLTWRFNRSVDHPSDIAGQERFVGHLTCEDRRTSLFWLDFVYQEAFLTTYRTFLTPNDLIDKLIQRYIFFAQIQAKPKLARYAFSLLIRVIDEIESVVFSHFLHATLTCLVSLVIN